LAGNEQIQFQAGIIVTDEKNIIPDDTVISISLSASSVTAPAPAGKAGVVGKAGPS
jgi:hypothetical protein